jgi:hypothetical protein
MTRVYISDAPVILLLKLVVQPVDHALINLLLYKHVTDLGSFPSNRSLVISSGTSSSLRSCRKYPFIPEVTFEAENPCTMIVPSAVNTLDNVT